MDDARALELWVEMAGRIFASRSGGWEGRTDTVDERAVAAKCAAEDARLVFEAVEEVSGHSLITDKEVIP